MRYTYFTLVGALSLSGVSASVSPQLFSNSILEYAAPERIEERNATSPNLLARFLTNLSPRQNTGRCGAEFSGQRCGGNQCCSSYGYCGTDFEHCAELVGCQPQYGRCGDAPPEPSSTPAPPSSTPAPPSSSSTPVVSSSSSTPVVPSSSSTQPPLPSGSLIVSNNGQCGNSTTCAGSPFGNCCSEFYFCGNGAGYCGTGCRSAFGICGGGQPPVSSSSPVPSSTPAPPSSTPTPTPSSTPTPTPSSSPTPSSTAQPVPTNVSTDGQCGANGKTCQGSTYGRCCSDYGWCGSQQEYCSPGWGCQPQFGTCG